MTAIMRIGGYLLLILGLVWIASIMGGVASRAEGFTDVMAMVPGYAFHMVCMLAGMALVVRASAAKRAAQPQPTLAKQS